MSTLTLTKSDKQIVLKRVADRRNDYQANDYYFDYLSELESALDLRKVELAKFYQARDAINALRAAQLFSHKEIDDLMYRAFEFYYQV